MSEQKVSVTVEQHIIIKFLTIEGIEPSEILHRLKTQFGEACLSITGVIEWCKTFREGIERERENERAREREREKRTRHTIIHREYQSPHPILTVLSCLYRIIRALL